jgi:hypothetical protein
MRRTAREKRRLREANRPLTDVGIDGTGSANDGESSESAVVLDDDRRTRPCEPHPSR